MYSLKGREMKLLFVLFTENNNASLSTHTSAAILDTITPLFDTNIPEEHGETLYSKVNKRFLKYAENLHEIYT